MYLQKLNKGDTMQADKETWEFIPGYDSAYSVSTMGRVKSHDRRVPVQGNSTRFSKGKMLKPIRYNQFGHLKVELKGMPRAIHRLVLETFVGPCPAGLETRHLNGNPADNRLDNLAWGTTKENCQDTVRHGNSLIGERNKASKLTERQVKIIRSEHNCGLSKKFLAKHYGVTRRTISHIINRKTWKHI